MKKNLGFNNVNDLRKKINQHLEKNNKLNSEKINHVNFIDKDILIKEIDYYHTNSIARSSKVMNECKQIAKNFTYNGIGKINS